MVKKIELGQIAITVDSKKTSQQIKDMIKKRYTVSHDADAIYYGCWCEDKHTIYIAKDMSPEMRNQVLIHEIAEAMNTLGEFNFQSHDKVLLLEYLITNLITKNPKFIESINKCSP